MSSLLYQPKGVRYWTWPQASPRVATAIASVLLPSRVVSPSCKGSTHAALSGTRSPLQNFTTPSVVCPAQYGDHINCGISGVLRPVRIADVISTLWRFSFEFVQTFWTLLTERCSHILIWTWRAFRSTGTNWNGFSSFTLLLSAVGTRHLSALKAAIKNSHLIHIGSI